MTLQTPETVPLGGVLERCYSLRKSPFYGLPMVLGLGYFVLDVFIIIIRRKGKFAYVVSKCCLEKSSGAIRSFIVSLTSDDHIRSYAEERSSDGVLARGP